MKIQKCLKNHAVNAPNPHGVCSVIVCSVLWQYAQPFLYVVTSVFARAQRSGHFCSHFADEGAEAQISEEAFAARVGPGVTHMDPWPGAL